MTRQAAFAYVTALYGKIGDIVERYGKLFEPNEYRRAMNDEFDRNRYRVAIEARIDSAVRRIKFGERFLATGTAELGEYNFTAHSFPITTLSTVTMQLCGDCNRSNLVVFAWDALVNWHQFALSLPMEEAAASRFVKARTVNGVVDRRIAYKIVYAVVNRPLVVGREWRSVDPSDLGYFQPFVYSVDLYADTLFTRPIGTLPRNIPNGEPHTAEEWQNGVHDAQLGNINLGTFHVVGLRDSNYSTGHWTLRNVIGDVTITDAGITWVGKDGYGGAPLSGKASFLDASDACYQSGGGSSNVIQPCLSENHEISQHIYREDWDWMGHKAWLVHVGGMTVLSEKFAAPYLSFATRSERDAFFRAISQAVSTWQQKYPWLVVSSASTEQGCYVMGRGMQDICHPD